jgi:phosphatidylinositol alpha-mannosyltransferase
MNIGLVCPYEWTVPGGVGNHVRALAAELRRAGHRVDVLAPAERPVTEPGFVGLGGSVAVPYNGSVARIAFGPRTLARVRRAVHRGGYDLLHVHEPLSPSAGLLAVTSTRTPTVGTFHANLGRSLALEAASPLLRRVYDRLAGRIAVSASARDTWQGQFGGAMAVVPNGVGAEFFARPEPLDSWKADGPTLLFVGRLEPRKGLTYLVRAFLRLKPAFPRLRLLVVGRDDRHQRDKAMSLVPPRLRTDLSFVGSVPQADLPSYYASADVFCAPSLGGESFGIVLAEAMAVGRPVATATWSATAPTACWSRPATPRPWPRPWPACSTTRPAWPPWARRRPPTPAATPGRWWPPRSPRSTRPPWPADGGPGASCLGPRRAGGPGASCLGPQREGRRR